MTTEAPPEAVPETDPDARPETSRRLPERRSIQDVIDAVGGAVTERQIRHWLAQKWCMEVEHVHVGGRVQQRWEFGPSGFAHAVEVARLHSQLQMHPALASEVASALLMTGEYVSEHFTLCATRALGASE